MKTKYFNHKLVLYTNYYSMIWFNHKTHFIVKDQARNKLFFFFRNKQNIQNLKYVSKICLTMFISFLTMYNPLSIFMYFV